MRRSIVEALSFLVAASLSSGCATSHCSNQANSNDPDCQPKNDMGTMAAAFMVTPLRLPIAPGSSTPVSVSAGSMLASKAVSLTQGGATFPLGNLDASGKLMKTVAAANLKNFTPGPATIAIAGKPEVVTVRIYIDPVLDSMPTATYDASGDCSPCNTTVTAYSASLGTFSKTVLAVNYYDDVVKGLELRSYSVDMNGNFSKGQAFVTNAKRFGDLPIGIAISKTSFSVADYNNSICTLTTCTDITKTSSCKSAPQNNITSVVSLAANSLGAPNYIAGIFDTGLKVYTQTGLNLNSASMVPRTGTDPNTGQPSSLAVGDLNGDASPDMVVLYAGGIAVYTSSSTKPLDYNSSYSMKLQETQNGTGITPNILAMGDIDGDGLEDIVISDGTRLGIIINQGDGTFKSGQPILVPASIAVATAIAIGDVGDLSSQPQGITDIVLSSKNKKTLTILRNKAQY